MAEILTLRESHPLEKVLPMVLTISFFQSLHKACVVRSALSSSWQTSTVSVSLQQRPKSIRWAPTPLFPHSWTRSQDTWTFPLGAATRPWLKVCTPLFPSWDQRPQTWRSQYSPLHTRLQTTPANRLTSGESGEKMIGEKPAQPIQEQSLL